MTIATDAPTVDKLELLDKLVGIIPDDALDEEAAREERLNKQ